MSCPEGAGAEAAAGHKGRGLCAKSRPREIPERGVGLTMRCDIRCSRGCRALWSARRFPSVPSAPPVRGALARPPRASADRARVRSSPRRFVVTKHSWKGRYQRIFCVSTSRCVTLHPQTLAVTNAWSIVNDPDVSAISIGAGDASAQDFTLTCRNDKKSKASWWRHVVAAMRRLLLSRAVT